MSEPRRMRSLIVVVALLLTSPALAQQFEEVDGYVLMEMESVAIPSGHEWEERTDIDDAVGTHYFFTGNGICNGPAGSALEYTFRIHTAGTYRLHLRAARTWHCVSGEPHGDRNRCEESDRACTSLAIPEGNSCPGEGQCIRTDISNDAFVHVETASGDYVPFIDQPDGVVGEPIKLFGGGNQSWGWTGNRALDIAHAKWDADWVLEPGDYTLVVQGRSQMFRIDRMMFYDTARGSRGDGEGRAETLFDPPEPDPDAGVPTDTDAGTPMPATVAGASMPGTDAGSSMPRPDGGTGSTDDDSDTSTMEGGCSAAGRGHAVWLLLGLLALHRRRRT